MLELGQAGQHFGIGLRHIEGIWLTCDTNTLTMASPSMPKEGIAIEYDFRLESYFGGL